MTQARNCPRLPVSKSATVPILTPISLVIILLLYEKSIVMIPTTKYSAFVATVIAIPAL